jgi:hypothetical protein
MHLPTMARMGCTAGSDDGLARQAARPRRRVRARIRRTLARTRTRTLWPERMLKTLRPAPCSKVGGLASVPPLAAALSPHPLTPGNVFISVSACVSACLRVCMCVCSCMCVYVCVRVSMCVCIYIYI